MIAIPINTVKDVISNFQKEIDLFTLTAISNLQHFEKKEKKKFTTFESNYIDYLIKKLDKIIIATPDELKIHLGFLGKVPTPVKIKRKKGSKPINKAKTKSFSEKIIAQLEYQLLRKKFYPNYFAKIGIKSCVYCNSQLTVSVDSQDYTTRMTTPMVKAKFQLDHHLPQSEYPAFGISLFNLYPTCGSCNNAKGIIPVDFQLYSNDPLKLANSDYKFQLDKTSLANYLIHRKMALLKIDFIDPAKPFKNVKVIGSFQDTFDIVGIYETQMDLAEDLILLARVYNKKYKQTLLNSFSKLFTGYQLSTRALIGNYTEPTEIHKRPMAKFTQDIARQLRLIR
jgi:hypothetical protein